MFCFTYFTMAHLILLILRTTKSTFLVEIQKQFYLCLIMCRLKEFIKFLFTVKGLFVDKTYMLSNFSERYDNQETEEDDRSLTAKHILS